MQVTCSHGLLMKQKFGPKTGSRMLLQDHLETTSCLDCHMHAEPYVPDRSLCLSSDLSLGETDRLVVGMSQIGMHAIIKYHDRQSDYRSHT